MTTPLLQPDSSGIVTWIHFGDLHMVRAGEQNSRDLDRMIAEVNAKFGEGAAQFVYLPGDVADDGSARAYECVRASLNQLQLPVFAVVGDHDVHEGSFDNFQRFLQPDLYGAFTVGHVRFLRLNCFSQPRPDSFTVDDEQLRWLETELQHCGDLLPVLLMHCYPSDLKSGGDALTELIHRYRVRLVDMGHTHYNEISNDGTTLYSATRSTGQVEEGPVGYTVLSVDGDCISWHFCPIGRGPLVCITQPADERLLTGSDSQRIAPGEPITARVRVFGGAENMQGAHLEIVGDTLPLQPSGQAGRWTATLPGLADAGSYKLKATVFDGNGVAVQDSIRLRVGKREISATRSEVDQENALGSWPERGLVGTQLGPNKNGRQW